VLNTVTSLRRHHRLAMPLLAPAVSRIRVDAEVLLVSSSGWAHGMSCSGRKVIYCHAPARWCTSQASTSVAALGFPGYRESVGSSAHWRFTDSGHPYATDGIPIHTGKRLEQGRGPCGKQGRAAEARSRVLCRPGSRFDGRRASRAGAGRRPSGRSPRVPEDALLLQHPRWAAFTLRQDVAQCPFLLEPIGADSAPSTSARS
jgi:hypothetical protein